MLYFDKEKRKVSITPVGLEVKEFKNLFNSDKTKEKTYFQDCITFIYYCFAKKTHDDNGSIYINYPLQERMETVVDDHIDSRKTVKGFLKDNKLQLAIDKYNRITKTPMERNLEDLYEDMANSIKRLKNIPEVRKEKITVEVTIPPSDKERIEKLDVPIEVDNTNEKIRSYKMINEILELEEKYKEKMKKEDVMDEYNPYVFETKTAN